MADPSLPASTPALTKEGTRRSGKAGDVTLSYHEAGPDPAAGEPVGGGLPLVMLHGGGPGASSWSNFGSALPGFAQHFRTLLVDQPGFGASDKPEVVGNYFRFAAEAVKDLLDELGIDRIHLLGNSLGGGTAMRMALSHPDRVGRARADGPGGTLAQPVPRRPDRGRPAADGLRGLPDSRIPAPSSRRWWSTRSW